MLEWLTSSGDPEGSRQLVLMGEWPLWVHILVIAMSALILGLTVYNYRSTRNRRRRWVMIGLRALIVALLLFLFYQPAFIEESVQRSRNTVVMLLDDSESMALPHESSTRLAAERRFVEEHQGLLDELGKTNDIEVLRFSDAVEPLEGDDWTEKAAALSGKGKATPLLETLEQVRERYRNKDLGGIILVSDGVDNGKLSHRLEGSDGLDDETLRFIESLGVPIYAFGFTGQDALRDVAVQRIRASSFAFHLNATALDATVRITGYPVGTQVRVGLYENGRLLTNKVLSVEEGKRDYDQSFDFVPRTLGNQVYAVAAELLPGEVYAGNNEKLAIVSVIRDRIRVLQICGHPSWDERFLRNHLKRNPNVDLISFFILINPRNLFAVSQEDTALIPFPAEELFVEELGGFDLIIFQDFNHGPFQTRQHLFRVRDFVKNGGAFLMLGGRLSLSEGGYFGTEITEVLPVEISPSFGGGQTLSEEEYKPILTDAGRTHPITRLELEPEANERLWDSLPPLEGLNQTVGLAEDSVSLLDHPTERGPRGRMPVVAVREVGKGRSMAVATDSSWLWSFKYAGEGGSSAAYNTFWENAIKWLIRDPELELLKVVVDSSSNELGDKVHATVRVFGIDYKPAPGHLVNVLVKRRGGLLTWDEEQEVLRMDGARTDEQGEIPVDVDPTEPGVYEVTAAARIKERDVTASQLFLVLDENPELRDVVSEHDALGMIAAASGGALYGISAEEPELRFREPRIMKVTRRDRHDLWSGADMLLLACLLLGAEWWLRRKSGYL